MPTESTFFFAGLLFLAAGLGYFFARFGDLDDDPQSAESYRFLKGFRYLLNEEPDRAVEAFTGDGDLNDEALETQLSLGALFRRRGELERAIRIHQNLLDRPGLAAAQRDRAVFALAEDFLGAGLFDRAEELLLRLRDSAPFRVQALGRLVRVCEMSREWERAIEFSGELGRLDPSAVQPVQLANYYCELAAAGRAAGDAPGGRRALEEALAAEPGSSRARLMAGDFAADAGDAAAAGATWLELVRQDPRLWPEVLPRLLALPEAARPRDGLESPERLGEPARTAIAAAVVRNPKLVHPAALAILSARVAGDPVLAPLVGAGGAGLPMSPERLAGIRQALHRLAQSAPGYRCETCGYASESLQWQCPGCRSWESIRASTALLPGAPRA